MSIFDNVKKYFVKSNFERRDEYNTIAHLNTCIKMVKQ